MKVLLPYPPSQNRYLRHTARGTYRTKEAYEYLDTVQKLARMAGAKLYDGSVEMVVTLHPRTTKSGKSSKVRLDLDNCVKVACDALNGVCYRDDRQIVKMVLDVGRPLVGGGLYVEVYPHAVVIYV